MKDQPNEIKHKKNSLKLEEPDIDLKQYSLSTTNLAFVNKSGYNITSISLPKNFFENLLILEMDLEEEFSTEKLIQLVQQYSNAIEYYTEENPIKAKAYQNRMEYLLTNKDTLMKLKRQNENMNNNNGENNANIKFSKNKERKDKINMNIKLEQEKIKHGDITTKLNKVLSSNKKDDNKISGKNIIKDDLEKQNLNWKEKLRLKKLHSKSSLLNKNKIKNNNDDLEISKFKCLSENLNMNRDDDKIDKKKKEKIKENEELIKNIIITEKNNDNNIIEDKNEKGENKEKENNNENNENIILVEEEMKKEDKKEDKNVEEKIIEEESKEKEKDKNEIKEEKKENTENLDQNINITKLTEENSKPQENNNPISLGNSNENKIASIILSSPSNEQIDNLVKINPDEEITKSIDSQINSLQNIISNLSKKLPSNNEAENEEEEESEFSNSNKNMIIIKNTSNTNNSSLIEKIPLKFKEAFSSVEKNILKYMNDFNLFFYKEIFEQFSSGLKDLYEMKYKKYIEIRNEYHNQIIENEYLLETEDKLTNEKKEEYQQTIESLKEEQQHQIDVIEDEFNKKIMDKISEFKINSFKKNSGIQLLEEKVKLDIYSLINEAFFN